jgi:hypothetical protein
MQKILLGIGVDFEIPGQVLITYFTFIKHLRKKWEYNKAVHQLFPCIDFKKARLS